MCSLVSLIEKEVKKMIKEYKPVTTGLLTLINKYQDGVRLDGGGTSSF